MKKAQYAEGYGSLDGITLKATCPKLVTLPFIDLSTGHMQMYNRNTSKDKEVKTIHEVLKQGAG